MKALSLIAAGLLAFGITAARADVDNTSVEVIPPGTQPPPPTAGVPGNVPAAPTGSATMPSGADVNVNPPAPPAAAPPPSSVRPPARVIDANTAAINGSVTEPQIPVPQVQPPPVQPVGPPLVPPPTGLPDHGTMHDTGHTWVGRLGSGFLVGGGYEDFTNSTIRNLTSGGGSWAARALVGTRQFVGVEGAYVGAARSVEALGVSSNAVLVSNGLEGNVRVNIPVVMQHAQLLEPFAFIGLGWQHYAVTNTIANTSDLAKNDDVMTVPVGGGIEYAIGRFMADARFTYRPTYYADLMRNGGSLSNWGVGGLVGMAF